MESSVLYQTLYSQCSSCPVPGDVQEGGGGRCPGNIPDTLFHWLETSRVTGMGCHKIRNNKLFLINDFGDLSAVIT